MILFAMYTADSGGRVDEGGSDNSLAGICDLLERKSWPQHCRGAGRGLRYLSPAECATGLADG